MSTAHKVPPSFAPHERLTLRRPYSIDSVETHRQAIYVRGERPPLYNSGIPKPLQDLLANSWNGDVARRFTMHEAVGDLRDILSDSNQPAPLSRADSNSFDICLSTASSIFWQSLETLWNTVVNDFRAGHDHDECRESNILDSCIVTDDTVHIHSTHTAINSPENADLRNPVSSNDNNDSQPRKTFLPNIVGDDVPVDCIPNINSDKGHSVCGKDVGDRYYKDRLLRSIHTVHRHYRMRSGPAPPNQVVSPSA